MTAKHTPGPWILDKIDSEHLYIVADQGKQWDNPTICALYEDVTPDDSVTFTPWYKSFENSKANAQLIAAAPELLEALETLLAVCPYSDNNRITQAMEKARKVISHAKII